VPEAEAEELSGNKSRVDLKKWDLIFKSWINHYLFSCTNFH
jgi:hypothetical protein